MNMMTSIASMATEMRNAQFAMSYSVAMIEKTMDAQEELAQGMLELLPAPSMPTNAQFIDTYA